MTLLAWLRGRKRTASATALAVLIAAPVTVAVLHQGFPISDVNLASRDVWVTNGHDNLTGRLNMQIGELNASAYQKLASKSFDVMQDGTDVFVYSQDQGPDGSGSIERVDPADVTLGQKITVPQGAAVTFGGKVITIVRPSDGALWVVPATGKLEFDTSTAKPLMKLGANAQAVVTLGGVVFAVSAKKGELYRIEGVGAVAAHKASVAVKDYTLSAVGDRAVILDTTNNQIIKDDGGTIPLDSKALRIQQVGPDKDFVVVASGDSLLKVSFNGQVVSLPANITSPATDPVEVAAPVVVGDCIHGAWAAAKSRYLGACDGKTPSEQDINQGTKDSRLEFRVNRAVVALNDVVSGNVWLVTQNMTLVNNWKEVAPPRPDQGQETDQTVVKQTFEDTLAQRTEENHPPVARDDNLGVRPGKSTILSVLDNDTDPDGDVLTISSTTDTTGALQIIDGGQALQFTSDPAASGTASFGYTVSDGRPGGVAEAQVNVAIRQATENLAPTSVRPSGVEIEAGQTVTYNVLTDWIDPDGDVLQVTAASPATADVVRFRPDGQITFTNTSTDLGQKVVNVTVSDGTLSTEGQLIVDVKATGELSPVGTPDFASTFVGKSVAVSALDNDRSPSGAPLTMVSVKALTEGVTTSLDLDHGVVTATAGAVGAYYLEYTLAAGVKTSIGVIRVDVLEEPAKPLPPTAVKDTAYVRPNEPTTLAALANDQSPSGRVIGIQSVSLPPEAEQLSVEVLNSAVLRITAPSGMTAAVTFTYTISDGLNSSTAGVTVVPVPELTKHQAPIAKDDTIKVRVGDIASVSVLDNDYHPDGARMLLDPTLVQTNVGDDGLAFVTGNTVRIQAPTVPGQYSVTYRIYDAFNESAVANVVFTVLADDAANNAAPMPRPLTARVFQGGSVTIEVPLSGIDPDGDSTVLVSASGAGHGEVIAQSSTAFTYQAYNDAAALGTDSFTYEVRDSFGKTATGQIQIGVIKHPATVPSPTAVNDAVSIRPGRTASIPVMANDSDPSGYPISIEPKLLEVQDGITAKVDNKAVVVTAGDVEGTFVFHYAITNGKGGKDDAFVTVKVSKDAPLQPPVAIDHVVEVKDIVGKKTVDVKVLDGAQNPGGLISDLVVTVEGANAGSAEILAGGIVRVTLGDSRQAIAYRLTNKTDDLSAMAFVVVPKYTSNLPPVLKPALVKDPPVIGQNQTKQWKLTDLLDVPSGREVRVINGSTATAGRSNGDPVSPDQFTIQYTPEKDYRGQALITFQVTDGDSASDTSGNQATIQLRVVVGDPNFEDVPPTFSDSTVSIQAGEAATSVDLRAASSHPNPSILAQLSYSDMTGQTSDIQGNISGSTLSVSAPFGVQPGATTTLKFNVVYKGFTVPAQVQVRVVASTRPPAQAVDDVEPEGRASSTYTISPLDNDFNPFAAEGKSLKIVNAQFEGNDLGATMTSTASTVTVHTGTTKAGTISIIYTIRDATDTAAREVQGRITVVVASAPEPVTSFVLSNPGSQTVTVVFDPPSSSNGAVITSYTVQIAGSPGTASRIDCQPGSACTFTGRDNGASQTVTVAATNKVGTAQSGSQSITPYGTPSPPTGQVLSTNSAYATATITPEWFAPSDNGGGSITYQWNFTQGSGASGSTGGTSGSGQSVGQGDYTFQVRACNPGGCSAFVSASRHIDVPPTWSVNVDAADSCAQQTNAVPGQTTGCKASNGHTWIPAGTGLTVSCYVSWSNLSVAGEVPSIWYYISTGSYSGYYVAHRTLAPPNDPNGYVPSGMPGC
ncbi:MAG: fibronectin type protein [Rhodoglobus sp.]|nr:fibronectin type protein [Rhodoglobus sp.]